MIEEGGRKVFQGGGLSVPLMQSDLPLMTMAQLFFRPHSARLATTPTADAGLLWVSGTVASVEFTGEFTRYGIDLGQTSVLVDQPHLIGDTIFAPGARLSVGLTLSQTTAIAK